MKTQNLVAALLVSIPVRGSGNGKGMSSPTLLWDWEFPSPLGEVVMESEGEFKPPGLRHGFHPR